jgi:cell division protein FtsZ
MILGKHKYVNIEGYSGDERPRFVIVGVGGSGCNTIRRIYEEANELLKFGTRGIDLVMCNTDYQSLQSNSRISIYGEDGEVITEPIEAVKVIQLGEDGLGAGSNVEVGAAAARDSAEEIYNTIERADIVIVVAGFGGGTGTGAAPVIADMAKKMGKVVLGFITTPFRFEGRKKLEIAKNGLDNFIKAANTTIGVSNQALFSVINTNTPLSEAYDIIDNVVIQFVESLVRMLKHPDLMNLDFADFKKATQQEEGGIGLVGFGSASGPDCDKKAVDMALAAPLFEAINADDSIPRLHGATNLLIHIISNGAISLNKVETIVSSLTKDTHPDVIVKVGVTILNKNKKSNHDSFVTISEPEDEQIKIVFIATGFKEKKFEDSKFKTKKYEDKNYGEDLDIKNTSTYNKYQEEEREVSMAKENPESIIKNTENEKIDNTSFLNINKMNKKENEEKDKENKNKKINNMSFLDAIKNRFKN